jgi:hypothetical protein
MSLICMSQSGSGFGAADADDILLVNISLTTELTVP